MVIPLRTLTYGIPLLLVGLLAALPFRRGSETSAGPDEAHPATSTTSRIEPIEPLPVSALPPWDAEPEPLPVDPMQSLRQQFAPMAESYQAVAIPLERPAKIADRFSAVARPPATSAAEQPPQPLAGHPATLASTRRRGQRLPQASWGDSSGGWQRGLPIPALSSDGRVPARESAAKTSGRSAAKTPQTASSSSGDRWPTPAELASAKRTKVAKPAIREPAPQSEQTARDPETAAAPPADQGGDAPATRAASQAAHSLQPLPKQNDSDRQRFFIREPTG